MYKAQEKLKMVYSLRKQIGKILYNGISHQKTKT